MTSQIMMWVEVFAVVMLLFPMVEDIRQYYISHRISRYIIFLQGAVICMLIVNVAFVAIQDPVRIPPEVRPVHEHILRLLMFVFYYASIYFFILVVQGFIEAKVRVSALFGRIVLGICIANTLFRIVETFIVINVSASIGNTLHHVSGVFGQVGTVLYILVLASMLWYHRRSFSSRSILVISTFVLLPSICSVVSSILHIQALVQLSMAVAMIILNVSLFRETDEELRMKEVELTRARVRILRSQVSPHFLFNTLNAIYVLCEKDPAQAQQAVSDFSEYLRANLDVLENDMRISFTREMEHVDHYLSLEKMRFRNELNVEKHIEATNFIIPVLTVQPIVENAINHGIGHKAGGGTVTIRSEEDDEDFIVTISDDGVGFDTSILSKNADVVSDERESGHQRQGDWMKEMSEKKHASIGLKNVRERIELMSDAKMTVDSVPGTGTIVSLRFPKKNNAMA